MARLGRSRAVARALATAFISTTALAASGGDADAAVYAVDACQRQDGTPTYIDGIAGGGAGQTGLSNSCDTGGTLRAWLDPANTYFDGDHAEWTLTAPPDTTLAWVNAERSARADVAQPYGTPVAQSYSDRGAIERFAQVAGSSPGDNGGVSYTLNGARWLAWGVACEGANGCLKGDTSFSLKRIHYGLDDTFAPTFVTNPGGTLTQATNLQRSRSLSFEAADHGGGVYRSRLTIDGAVQAPQTVDNRTDWCAEPFQVQVPCLRDAFGTVTLDTATLADGDHTLALSVYDATDANKVQFGPWTITADNQPATVTSLSVAGVPRVGDTLTASATADGQDPTITFQWYRADSDGGNQAAIDGATGATYTLQPIDQGRKVLVKVTAADHGGSGSRMTTLTDAPFDGGRTVEPYCSGRPTGKTEECGDWDADGVVNREDADDDNDGVLDTDDPAPFDADTPGRDPCAGQPTGPQDPCGDYDGDGLLNTGDTDDDNDGIADAADAKPFEAAGHEPERADVAATPSARIVNPNDPAAVAAPNPAAAGGPNGDPADGMAVLNVRFERGHGSTVRTTGRLVAAFDERARIRGTITTQAGQPIRGATVFLAEKRPGAGEQTWRVTSGSAVSRDDGSFALTAQKRGQSRELRLVYYPRSGSDANRASNPLSLQVRQDATLRLSRHRLHNGQRLQFRGSVRGAVPMHGAAVQMQVKLRSGWFTFRRLTVKRARAGRFRTSYRFLRTHRRTTYRFRVRVVPASSTRYATGFSKIVSAVVLP